jgi:arginyl-tRNA synthetase
MNLQKLKNQIAAVLKRELPGLPGEGRFGVGFTSDPKFGDVAVNAAMVYAKDLGLPPRQLAEKLVPELAKMEGIAKAEVAGPGFINLTLSDEWMAELAVNSASTKPTGYAGKVVVTEYSDPNPFKVLHVGHLYTSIVGSAITNLVKAAGGDVHPVNFGGDVGLHVGRTMWAILQRLGGENPEELVRVPEGKRAIWMAECYVEGTNAYEENEKARAQIIELNQKVYKIHAENDKTSPLAQIYWKCRQWSYDYFDAFYARLGIHFERYYPESETTPLGLATVKRELKKGVYTESAGAVVFKGEQYGLHTRVFITSSGLPTYEGKDVGLIMSKWQDYHFDKSIVITGNDIIEYMKVVLKSIEKFEPELAARSLHITHGNVKLEGSIKMSSRKGNILMAVDVLDSATEANKQVSGKDDNEVVIGAVKYAFLKNRIGPDLVYSSEESVSLEGNSGPYIQYAHARARSILAKTGAVPDSTGLKDLTSGERSLARKLVEFPEVLQQAVNELMPHQVCVYMYELAQTFNRFYEQNRVIGDARQEERLVLVEAYADVLRSGMQVLGVPAPDRL